MLIFTMTVVAGICYASVCLTLYQDLYVSLSVCVNVGVCVCVFQASGGALGGKAVSGSMHVLCSHYH